MTADKRAPGRWGYGLGVAAILAGVATMVAILATQITKLDDGLEQIVVPGSRTLMLEPGRQTVFLELTSVAEGKAFSVAEVSGLQVRVADPQGRPLALRAPGASANYSFGGRSGQSIQEFDVATAGSYVVAADYAGAAGPQTVIAVGHDFMGGLVGTVFGALGRCSWAWRSGWPSGSRPICAGAACGPSAPGLGWRRRACDPSPPGGASVRAQVRA